jgi:GTP-binding protein EngB required for normal cell division
MVKNEDLIQGANYEILFVGRSNVGKSTLIRQITGKQVKVGKRPGVTLKPTHIRFSDLLITDMPGFGFMSGVNEHKQDNVKDQIVRYIENNSARINLAVMVIDGNVFVDLVDRWEARNEIPVDLELYAFLQEMGIDTVVAVNKTDKIKDEDMDSMIDGIVEKLDMLPPWRQWIDKFAPISAKKGNIKPLKSLIRQRLHSAKRDDLFKYF